MSNNKKEFTIESRKFNKTVTFSVIGRYLYCDVSGTDSQMCDGGRTRGNTMVNYGDTINERRCRNWWAQYIREA